jgi:serine/threonine-protein kinase RIO1
MSFIGSEAQPAPKLKDVNLNEEQLKDAYQQIIQVNN